MKKLITLLLAVAGYVCTASAQVTEANKMKVYIQNKLVSSWDKIILRHWGYNNSRDAADVNETGTEVIDGITWHVFELSLNYANNAPFLVYNGTWGTTTQSSNYDSDGSVYGDTFFDLKQNDSSSQPYLERQTRFYLYNTDTKMSIKMSTADFSTYTLSLDNSTGDKTGYYAIASNYAYKDTGTGEINNWSDNAFRPQASGNLEVGFQNYTSQSAPRNSDGGVWHISAKAVHEFTFVPGNWSDASWSLSTNFSRTITSAGIATFSSEYAVAIPSGITASYVTGAGSNNVLTTTAFANGIPANTGALLTGDAGTYTFTPATTTNEVSGNKLVAKTEAGSVSQTEEVNATTCTNYVLTTQTVDNANAPARFYKVNSSGNTVGAGKAYLRLAPSDIASARDFFFIWEEDATAIDAVKSNAAVDGQAYNLAGQRVAQPTKGLYIVNGKKVIMN